MVAHLPRPSAILGGAAGAGRGWTARMEALAGGAELTARIAGALLAAAGRHLIHFPVNAGRTLRLDLSGGRRARAPVRGAAARATRVDEFEPEEYFHRGPMRPSPTVDGRVSALDPSV